MLYLVSVADFPQDGANRALTSLKQHLRMQCYLFLQQRHTLEISALELISTKGFEIGSGFSGARMRGSAHNDRFVKKADGMIGTATNNSGGIQGGVFSLLSSSLYDID